MNPTSNTNPTSTMNLNSTPSSNLSRRRLLTGLSTLAIGGAALSVLPAVDAAAWSVGPKIKRSEVLARAKYWYDHGSEFGYVNEGTHPDESGHPYRTDCSGYASMALHLTTNGTWWDCPGSDEWVGNRSLTTQISKDQLKAGDVLAGLPDSNHRMGHVIIFEKWADAGHTSYWAYNFGSTPVQHKIITYPYGSDSRDFHPYRYVNIIDDPVSGPSWHGVSGGLTQLDLGPQSELWGVNAAGTIYSYAGDGAWAAHGSEFKQVSVGKAADGGPHVYALKTNGSIQRWTGSAWQPVSGVLTQLDLGPQGDLWGVNAAGNIYEYAGNSVWTVRGSGFKNVSVGAASDGGPHVYAVRSDGGIARWRSGSWEGVAGTLANISLGPQGELWGVNAAGAAYQYAGSGQWTLRGAGFRNVSVGSATGSHVYAVRTDNTIQRWGLA